MMSGDLLMVLVAPLWPAILAGGPTPSASSIRKLGGSTTRSEGSSGLDIIRLHAQELSSIVSARQAFQQRLH